MDILWKRQRTKSSVESPKKKQGVWLPNQLGCRIIQLQMQVLDTKTLTSETIVELLQQYTKAIQFYEEKGSNRYLNFQKRMQNLLQKPVINQILKGKQANLIYKKQKKDKEVQVANDKAKIQLKKIIDNSSEDINKQTEIIKKSLISQDQLLEQRIQRKRTSSRSSRKKSSLSFSDSIGRSDFQTSDFIIPQKPQQVQISQKTQQAQKKQIAQKSQIQTPTK